MGNAMPAHGSEETIDMTTGRSDGSVTVITHRNHSCLPACLMLGAALAMGCLSLSALPASAHAESATSAQQRLADARRQIDALNAQAEQASEDVNAANATLDALDGQISALESDMGRDRQALADSSASAYKSSGYGIADAMEALSSGSLDSAISHLSYARRQGEELSSTVRSVVARSDEAAAKREQQAKVRDELEANRSALSAKAGELEAYRKSLGEQVVSQLASQTQGGMVTDVSVAEAARQSLAANGYAKNPNATTTGGRITEEQRRKILDFAYSKVGRTTYVWGAGGMDSSSYDCSGLVQAAYASAGLSLPHSSAADAAIMEMRPISELEAGDIVYWKGHVAIYAGNGQTVESMPGRGVVMFRIWGNPVGGGNPYA